MGDQSDDVIGAFAVQANVRGSWRAYLDGLEPLRGDLFRFCLSLTGSIWDAEDLVQDALMRVFSLLGKIDADLDNPRAYLFRTAQNLWIDRVRRQARERMFLLDEARDVASESSEALAQSSEAAGALLQNLHPQERAAVVLKDVLDFSLADTAEVLCTTISTIKSALRRGRGRIDQRLPAAGFASPPAELVAEFMRALKTTDLDTLKTICATELNVEMVGGVETGSFDNSKLFFQHAHFVMPELGFGENPHRQIIEYLGEPMVLGLRTLNSVDGINEVHRLEVVAGRIVRVRCYCFCPDVLKAIGEELALIGLPRPYRSPSMSG